jgi:hypothetical protein
VVQGDVDRHAILMLIVIRVSKAPSTSGSGYTRARVVCVKGRLGDAVELTLNGCFASVHDKCPESML